MGFNMNKYTDPSRNIGSTEFEVDKSIISNFVLEKLTPLTRTYPLDELMLMSAAVCRFKPRLILEWGTNIGLSAKIFYEITESFGLNSEIHSIDLPDDVVHSEHDPNVVGSIIKGINKINLHKGDGLTCALDIIKKNNIIGNVLFFIDGDHHYDSVKKELSTILENVNNAVILLHDTLYQSEDSGYYVGPHNAITDVLNNEILNDRGPYKRINMNIGGPGMSLIFNSNMLRIK
jgi:cephalosporin hydroxylase